MFGTYEKFNLVRAPYARRGSVIYLYEDFYKTGLLRLGMHKSGDMISGTDFLFDIAVTKNGAAVPYTYFADAGSLRLVSGDASVEFAITDRRHLRVRGRGAGARLTLVSTNPPAPERAPGHGRALRGIYPKPSGGAEADFGKYGRVFVKALSGTFHYEAPYNETGYYESLSYHFLPGAETGEFDAALHEYDGDEIYPFGWYEPFDKLAADNTADFESFKSGYRPVAKGYEETAEYAMWTIWSHRVDPRGYIKSPAMILHHQWAIVAASWQQSYNAMPMQRSLKEAWRLICSLFDYQDERTGRLPGMLAYSGAVAGMQPPFQGFALDFLIRNAGEDVIPREDCVRMYPKFAKWINYWTTYRSAGVGGDVTAIQSPHESGWDDASNFKDGFPASDPNTMAFLVLLMECTARLARGAGMDDDAAKWDSRASKLTKTIVDDFWDGEKFVTKVKGEPVDSKSLACFQPIILGKRLPRRIINRIAEKLMMPGEWLTEIGLASENMRSPLVTFGISFVCGRVVAPQNMIISVGLQAAGKQKEAEEIARRYCDQVKKEGIILGFAPYDHFPLTGEPAPDQPRPFATDGWPWNSWCANCFMTMASSVIDAG
ncbi:MAG: hypothetical protein LBD49_01755 [Oscillospiraceae bacterium]|jgi:hypothetical protein|nr:hypothetical protein [Oscillospiraceae bacterium]